MVLLLLLLMAWLVAGCSLARLREEGSVSTSVDRTPGPASIELAAQLVGRTELEVTVKEVRSVAKVEKKRTEYRWMNLRFVGDGVAFFLFDAPLGPDSYLVSPIHAIRAAFRDDVEIKGGVAGALYCIVMPWVTCLWPDPEDMRGGRSTQWAYDGVDYTETQEKVVREWTDIERTPKASRVVVEGPGGPIAAQADPSGRAVVSLRPVALAALAAGQERVSLRVRLVEGR